MPRKECAVLALMASVIVGFISYEIGQARGYQFGKESILELLSKYECMGHMILPNGSIECTTWARRQGELPTVRNAKP